MKLSSIVELYNIQQGPGGITVAVQPPSKSKLVKPEKPVLPYELDIDQPMGAWAKKKIRKRGKK